jgi:glycosyltransferase involved in cell wall biosynthesis
MRIIYVCPFTGLCGGIKVLAEHVSRLAARGHAAEWWGLDPSPDWFPRPVPYRRFAHTDALGAALRSERGVKVATWWQTASWVAANLRPGDVGAYLVQDEDELTYSASPAGTSYRLGLLPVTESEYVTWLMLSKYGIDPVNVGIGIDLQEFRPLNIPHDPDRIFTAYRPQAGPHDLKGFSLALRVVQLVRTENPRASLVTFGTHGHPPVPGDVPHIHVPSPPDWKLRELYSGAGVYLMTSRHEGFCLPAAEAMACGSAVVCTNAHGNMEYCRHAETALVGSTAEELAGHVLTLRRDNQVRKRIAAAGREFVRTRYRWEPVVERLELLFAQELIAPRREDQQGLHLANIQGSLDVGAVTSPYGGDVNGE